jgi:CBS domain containing-hemolysin-like protein
MARALFSFLETSITALRLFKLKELAASAQHYRPLFTAIEKTPHQVIISIIIANSLADVTTAALATNIMETFFARLNWPGGIGFSVGIGIAALTILIFGEIIPKNLARRSSDRLFRSTLWITNILFNMLSPIVNLLTKFSNFFINKIMGDTATETNSDWIASEYEIQFLIGHISQKGLMESEKTEMLQNIFDLGRTLVREIVVPAPDIISISSSSNIKDTLDVFVHNSFTRLPVYENTPDNIIGMIHLKDVFALMSRGQEKTLKNIMRPVLFVPDSIKVNQLLREFRQQHMHLAIILDEHGKLTGLITLEDVLEEIVGDIRDEHDPEKKHITQLKPGGWLVEANMPLEDLEEILKITFETIDSRTIGGFLTESLQHLPKIGERISYKNFYFQVHKASPRRVLQVLILESKDTEAQAPE